MILLQMRGMQETKEFDLDLVNNIHCLAYRCWTDSTKAGSTSRAVRIALSKVRSNCRPSFRGWWVEADENDFPKSSINLQETDYYEFHPYSKLPYRRLSWHLPSDGHHRASRR